VKNAKNICQSVCAIAHRRKEREEKDKERAFISEDSEWEETLERKGDKKFTKKGHGCNMGWGKSSSSFI
jgi:hypothetical protein